MRAGPEGASERRFHLCEGKGCLDLGIGYSVIDIIREASAEALVEELVRRKVIHEGMAWYPEDQDAE
jgi:hypothetical protein